MNKVLICCIAVAILSTAMAAFLNLFLGIAFGVIWAFALYEISLAPCKKTPEID